MAGNDNIAEGIIVEAIKPIDKEEPTARVFLIGVYDIKTLDDPEMIKKMPIMPINLGQGHSKTEGTTHTLRKDQRVLCRRLNYTDWEIFKLIPNNEGKSKNQKGGPKGGGSTGANKSTLGNEVPTTVEPIEDQNEKNPEDKIKSKFLVEIDLPALATANIKKMLNTVFSIINTGLIKIATIKNEFATIQGLLETGLEEITDDIHNFFIPLNVVEPENVIKIGEQIIKTNVSGAVDIANDFLRSVDIEGGVIGNIGDFIKFNGWPISLEDWEFNLNSTNAINLNGAGINVSLNGNINVPAGLEPGSYNLDFTISNKFFDMAKDIKDNVDDIKDNVDDIKDMLGTLGGSYSSGCDDSGGCGSGHSCSGGCKSSGHHCPGGAQPGSQYINCNITFQVICDAECSNTDYSTDKLLEEQKAKEPDKIGGLSGSVLVPQIEFEMNPRGTDIGTYSQIHLLTGPSNKTVSLELDFTTGPEDDVAKGGQVANNSRGLSASGLAAGSNEPLNEGKQANPRICMNHPSGSFIEINEFNRNNERDGKGGNIQIKSMDQVKVYAKSKLFNVSDDSINMMSKHTNLQTSNNIISNARSRIVTTNDGLNTLHMIGSATTLTSGPNKLVFFGGKPEDHQDDDPETPVTYDAESAYMVLSYKVPEKTKDISDELDIGIRMNDEEVIIKREPMEDESRIVFSDENIFIKHGETEITLLPDKKVLIEGDLIVTGTISCGGCLCC